MVSSQAYVDNDGNNGEDFVENVDEDQVMRDVEDSEGEAEWIKEKDAFILGYEHHEYILKNIESIINLSWNTIEKSS